MFCAVGSLNKGAQMNKVVNFLRDESGPTSVEYALLLALIAAAIIAAISSVGLENGSMMESNSAAISEALDK
jgi:pilus assembly protein Flp/PilA